MRLIVAKRPHYSLVAGMIVACREGVSRDGVRVFNITLEGELGKEKKQMQVEFWNSNKPNGKQMADVAKRASMGIGNFITAVVVFKDETFTKATGKNFKYNGQWVLPECLNDDTSDTERQEASDLFAELQKDGFLPATMCLDTKDIESLKAVSREVTVLSKKGNLSATKLKKLISSMYFTELNVFAGYIAHQIESDADGNYAKCSIPVTKYTQSTSDSNKTEWHKVTFYNNASENLADKARAELSYRNGVTVRCLVVAGAKSVYRDKANYRGFRFEVISSSDASPASINALNTCVTALKNAGIGTDTQMWYGAVNGIRVKINDNCYLEVTHANTSEGAFECVMLDKHNMPLYGGCFVTDKVVQFTNPSELPEIVRTYLA